MCRPTSAMGASRSSCRTRPSAQQTCRAAPSPSASHQPWPTSTSARSYSAGGAPPKIPLCSGILRKVPYKRLETGCPGCVLQFKEKAAGEMLGALDEEISALPLSPSRSRCQRPSYQQALCAGKRKMTSFSSCRNGVGPRPILWPRVRAWARSVQQHYTSSELEALQLHNVMQEVWVTPQDKCSGASYGLKAFACVLPHLLLALLGIRGVGCYFAYLSPCTITASHESCITLAD